MYTWTRPPIGSYKVNVKAIADNPRVRSSIACVARNCSGYWLDSYSRIMNIDCPVMSELWAIFYGLKMVFDTNLEIRRVEVESDSEVAVNHVLNPDTGYSGYDLVSSIRVLMNENLESCILRHVQSSSNQLAIEFAICSLEEGFEERRLLCCPSEIIPVMAEDWLASL